MSTINEDLTEAANSYLKIEGVGEQIRVTITDEIRVLRGQPWHVGSDQIIAGYGKNHRPEESLWQFEIIGGKVFVADSMSMENMVDLLEGEAA